MNTPPAIFPHDKILGGRGMVSGRGVMAVPPDPLTGIPCLLDLRTHRGDKLPYGINHIPNGTNTLWHGITGSAAQPSGNAQPLTKFTSDGTPYLDFDGVDDWMSVGEQPQQVTYTITLRSKTTNWSIWSAFLEHFGAVDSPNKWGALMADSNTFQSGNLPSSVRVNGLSIASPFAIPTPSGWNVITVETALSPAAVERAIFNWENRFFLNAQIIALFIHDGEPTTARIEAVESYFTSLKPEIVPDP